MRALILTVLLVASMPAVAECPPVAPQGERHIVLEKGDLAPSRGVFASEELAKYDLTRVLCAERARDACYRNFDEKPDPGVKMFVWGGAAGIVVGALVVALVKH